MLRIICAIPSHLPFPSARLIYRSPPQVTTHSRETTSGLLVYALCLPPCEQGAAGGVATQHPEFYEEHFVRPPSHPAGAPWRGAVT